MSIKCCIVCGRTHFAHNFCRSHYNKWRRGTPLERATCKIKDCYRKVYKYADEQLCALHYYIYIKSLQPKKYKRDGGKWGYKNYRKIQMIKRECCNLCGATRNLHLHHKDGDKRNSSFSNLITLCAKCHKRFHPKLSKLSKKVLE